jgi:equilibrative nucleoside transporter 1/2/3
MPTTAQAHQTFELQELSKMDRIKNLFRPQQEYEPLENGAERDDESTQDAEEDDAVDEAPFSSIEYAIFLLLGIAMLWAWYVMGQ